MDFSETDGINFTAGLLPYSRFCDSFVAKNCSFRLCFFGIQDRTARRSVPTFALCEQWCGDFRSLGFVQGAADFRDDRFR
jgi:hypothetical protein